MDMSAPGLRFPKARPRILDRIARKLELDQQMRACRKAVKARDQGRCRACYRKATEMHHIQKRSQGGTWQTGNIVHLCKKCHDFAHAGVLQITGNADQHLTISGRRPR